MKKLIPSLILAALASSSVYADTSVIQLSSGTSTPVPSTSAGCLILDTQVGVGLSAKVEGTVFCREADGSKTSMILVGTCHTAGLSKTRQVNCLSKLVDDGAGGTTTVYYPTDCGAGDVSVTVNGPSLFMADTATGGSMVENALGGTCDAATVQAFVESEAASL